METYLLAPNFDYPPGSSIDLGNLIADPFAPHRPLAVLAADRWPAITTTNQRDRVIGRGKDHGGNLSMGAQLLELVGARVGGEVQRESEVLYEMDGLRTEFFRDEPREDDVRALLDVPRVRAVLRGTFLSRPVFMITGLKIATGFSMSTSSAVSHGGNVGAELPVPIIQGVSVGFDVGVSKGSSRRDLFWAEQDVILAYRLTKIARRGWGRKRLDLEEWVHKSAFLSDEEPADTEDEGIEMMCQTIEYLKEAADEDADLQVVCVKGDAEEASVSIVFEQS